LTIPEIVILKLDEDIEKRKARGKDCWAKFDAYFSLYTIDRMKTYCKEKGYLIDVRSCGTYQTYDIIISW